MKLLIPPELELVDNVTSTNTDKALTANQGKVLKDLADTKTAIASIVNNLTTTTTNVPLSAAQGKVLKDAVDALNTLVASDTTSLDTLQEIVDYIETNRSTLDALGISNISGLQAALDAKIATADIKNNLTSTDTDKPLSANQGKILKDLVDAKQGTLTFGIGNNNSVKIDSSSVASAEYAVFTSNGLESRSTSQVATDLNVGGSYTLPTASSSTLGGVKVGSTLAIDSGVLDVKPLVYNGHFSTSSNSTIYSNSSDGFTFKWNSSANQITVSSSNQNYLSAASQKIDGGFSTAPVRRTSLYISASGSSDYFFTGSTTKDSDWDMEEGASFVSRIAPQTDSSPGYKIEALKTTSRLYIQIWRIA